jgi:uncharacterized protein (DUF2384 family)
LIKDNRKIEVMRKKKQNGPTNTGDLKKKGVERYSPKKEAEAKVSEAAEQYAQPQSPLHMVVDDQIQEQELVLSTPTRIRPITVLGLLEDQRLDHNYVSSLNKLSQRTQSELAQMLNITENTYRGYLKDLSKAKTDTKEHVIMLVSLFKHGIAVFDTIQAFNEWLDTENPFFDFRTPIGFLNTNSGVHYIDNRLTAMEYGDNV